MLNATVELNNKLLATLNKVQYTKELKQKALKAYLNAFTQLLHLKKVCEKVQSKKYYLVEQGLCKLKTDKKKEFKVESINTFNPYLLPLFNFFTSNFSFLILPDVLSDNTPVSFLQSILGSLLVFIQFLYILPIELCKIINYLLYYAKVSF